MEWKKMKKTVVGRSALKNLKSLNPESLKNLQNVHGKNLLHVAAKHASLPINKYLIEVGLDINAKSQKNDHDPLIYALLRNDNESKKIVKLLVNSGADMSWTDISIGRQSHILFHDKKNVAHLLCFALKKRLGSYKKVAEYLLDMDWSFDNISYLQHGEVTKYALKSDNLFANNKKLEDAVDRQDVHDILELLKLVNYSKRIMSWTLDKAILGQNSKAPLIIKLLLENGAQIHGFPGDDKTPAEQAFTYCRVKNLWMFLEQGVKIHNSNVFEHFDQLFRVRYEMRSVAKFRQQEQETMRDCFRVLIEHQGVENSLSLIQSLPQNLQTFGRLRIEYLAMSRNLSRNDDCEAERCFLYFDIFESNSKQRDYYQECNSELEVIKNRKVENVSLVDLLLKTIDEMFL